MRKCPPPTMQEEQLLLAKGYRFIAGIDEAGRGALAGPVAAAAVVLPAGADFPWLAQVHDSKLLSPRQREALYPCIKRDALAVGVAMVSPQDIDNMGILPATLLAMRMAAAQLAPQADFLLIDGTQAPHSKLPRKTIVRGDRLCLSIACASIVAKVTRDNLMCELDRQYPGYGLAQHKGYGTEQHLSCLRQLGACRIHRHSFAPMKTPLFADGSEHPETD